MANVSLHWGAEYLTKILPSSLRDRLDEIDTDQDHDFSQEKGFVQCNGETGEVILVMPGVMPRRVSRRKLRRLMSEGLDIKVCIPRYTSYITGDDALKNSTTEL